MADNIIIKITTEADLDAAQKQLQALTEKVKQQEKAVRDLGDQEKADADNIRYMVAEREKLKKALAENQRYYRDEKQAKKDEVTATKASIKELEKQIKSYKAFHGQSGTMVKQLRAMREELQRMEDSGQFGTQAFMDLAVAAGKLEDQIGDTQARIRVLSSDTIGLDTAMGVADGLSGAFYVATSAAEVFGTDLEALQEAFYRVQAAMSVVSGIQQIANTLNKDSVVAVMAQTAAMKLKQKAEARAAATTAANTVATGAQTAATGAATTAQWSLNAAIAANPLAWLIAIIVAAVAAVAALGVGVYALVKSFTAAGKAQNDFKEASKALENIQRENAVGAATRAQQQQELLRKQSDAQEEAMRKAEARNASEIEMSELSLKHAKEKHDAVVKYNDEEMKRNQKEIDKLADMVNAKQREVAAYRDGGKKQKKAMEELAEVEQQYAEALQKTADLETEKQDAWEAQQQAADALMKARQQMRLEAEQAGIDLMRDGAAKEIAQIKVNYREQLKVLQGNSEEEIALRKKLIAKQNKEIAEVRKKYALQAQETAILEQKNLLASMSQYSGTEDDYANQIALTKKIAEAEAQARVDALDRNVLSEREYAAQVEAIRLELDSTLRDIDEKEVQRLNTMAKRETEILLAEAEAQTKVLRGDESIEQQKAVWQEYYDMRKEQVLQNAAFEIEAINRSTASEEDKAAQVKQIQTQLNADLYDLKQEAATKSLEIDAQYLDDLQRNVEKAERATEKAQGTGKLEALQDRFEAEQELYQAQQTQLDAQYAAGTISYAEYENQRWEITKATEDSIANYRQEKMQAVIDGFTTAIDYMQQASDLVFEAISSNIQAQMDALDEMYTTDAQEAKENANKKYISEKELADKKAALEMKQARYAKAQAIINAGINTAQAILTTLAQLGATPWGIASAAIAGTMGAVQLGIIASKPLAQYAKGRKGGKGEYALVGEKGPEVMYVPEGASIVPNHYLGDMDAWSKFGVPALPNDMMLQALNIDYDRLGKAVAANIPQQKAVSVNVDRSGVTISDNGNRRTYLNHKYSGSWS
jgi:hypothetical protein